MAAPRTASAGVLSKGMGILLRAVGGPSRIEYLRTHFEPEKYGTATVAALSQPRPRGRLWARLGIQAPGMFELRHLARGINPRTGENLTARHNGRNAHQSRTAFLSLVFTAPKSLSIMSEIAGDTRIRGAFRESAELSLTQMEPLAGFRVRKRGAPDLNRHRATGEMAWLTRLETDSRHSDPHLHVHVEIFNATWDSGDSQKPFKALNAWPLFQRQRELAREFHAELATRIERLGHAVEWAGDSFEIVGVEQELIERFSTGRRRIQERQEQSAGPRNEIVAGISWPKKRRRSPEELSQHWRWRVTSEELAVLVELKRLALQGRYGARIQPPQPEVAMPLHEPSLPRRAKDSPAWLAVSPEI